MDQKIVKIVSLIILIIVILNITLFAFRKLSTSLFWVIIIIAALYAFIILPKIRK